MAAIVRRAILPALLLIAGVAAVVYGAMFHRVPVLQEVKSYATIDVPATPPSAGSLGPGSPFAGPPAFPGGNPFGGPPAMVKKTVKRVEQVTKMVSEPQVMREITVGGVALLKSGEIKQTYDSFEGKGPTLCPS